MQLALQLSLQDFKARQAKQARAQSSNPSASSSKDRSLESIAAEIREFEQKKAKLQAETARVVSCLQELYQELEEKQRTESGVFAPRRDTKGKGKAGALDYNSSEYEWSGALQAKLQSVFSHEAFRLCQEGSVCSILSEHGLISQILPFAAFVTPIWMDATLLLLCPPVCAISSFMISVLSHFKAVANPSAINFLR